MPGGVAGRGRGAGVRVVARLLAALVAAGCGGTGPEVGVVRDSAGLVVVEHGPGAAERVERWRAGAEPVVDVGVRDGAAAYRFLQLADALWLEDGRMLALDGGARQLRLFDAGGMFLTAHGRPGEGPGAYAAPAALWRLPDDSVAVWDARLRRVTVLGDRLGFGRTVAVGAEIGSAAPVAALEDGRLVVLSRSPARDGGQPVSVWAIDPGTGSADSLGAFPGNELAGGTWPVYGWRTAVAAGGDRVYVGTGREHEVEEHEAVPGGRLVLRRLIRWTGDDRAVSARDVEAYHRAYVERAGRAEEEREAILRELRSVPVAERKPAYGAMLVDADGNLWVMEYDFPWRAIPEETRWTVFSPDGRMRARATLPARFRPYEIRGERVLGQRFGRDGAQHLSVYALEKDAGGH